MIISIYLWRNFIFSCVIIYVHTRMAFKLHIRKLQSAKNHFQWNFSPKNRAKKSIFSSTKWRDQESVIVQLFYYYKDVWASFSLDIIFFFNSAKNFLPSDKLKLELKFIDDIMLHIYIYIYKLYMRVMCVCVSVLK